MTSDPKDSMHPAPANQSQAEARDQDMSLGQVDREAWEQWLSLEEGHPGFFVELMSTFIVTSQKALGELEMARAAGDVGQVRFHSHSLKSSTAVAGATEFSRRCYDIEKQASDSATLPSDEALRQMNRALRQIIRTIQDECVSRSAHPKK